MNKMASAFVLIAARNGMTKEVENKLMRMQSVRNIETVQGEYDLIAEVEAKNELKLDNIMHENIMKLKNVAFVSPLIKKYHE